MTRLPFRPTALFALIAIAGCGAQSYELVGSHRAPGADVVLTVHEIEGANHMIEVEIDNLLPPSRVGEGLTTYVLWFVPQGRTPILAGALEYDAGARRAEGRATVPDHRFEVRVTAERSAQVVSPGEHIVASRHVVHD